MAIIIDRITSGFALNSDKAIKDSQYLKNIRLNYLGFAILVSILLFIIASFFQVLADWSYNFSIWYQAILMIFFETFVKTFKLKLNL